MTILNYAHRLLLATGDTFVPGAGEGTIPAATRILFESRTLALVDMESMANSVVSIRGGILPVGAKLGDDVHIYPEQPGVEYTRVFFGAANPLSDNLNCESFDLTDLPIVPAPTVKITLDEAGLQEIGGLYVRDIETVYIHATDTVRYRLEFPDGGSFTTSYDETPEILRIRASEAGIWRVQVENIQGVTRTASLFVQRDTTAEEVIVDPDQIQPAMAIVINVSYSLLDEVYDILITAHRATSFSLTLMGRQGVDNVTFTRDLTEDPERLEIQHRHRLPLNVGTFAYLNQGVVGETGFTKFQIELTGPAGSLTSRLINLNTGRLFTMGPIMV